MKKPIILALLVAFAIMILTGCSTSNNVTTPQPNDTKTVEASMTEIPQHIHSFGDWVITKAATCTEAGEQERTCSCGERQTQTIAATGHSFGEWIVTKSPTCTETGEQERTCTCGEKQTQTIAATGHTFGDWVVTKAATCTEDGEQERTCTCGEKQTQTIAAKGHSFGQWKTTKEATCTKDGQKSHSCTVCGVKEDAAISATGHQWKDATCTEPKTCSVCGTTQGNALGHNYQNGVCTRCHEKAGATIILPSAGNKYNYYYSSGKLVATCEVTKIETPKVYSDYNPQKLWYKVKVAMKSTYDLEGNNYSRAPYVGYKIYDEDNVVVNSGTLVGENIKVGETCYAQLDVYYLEAGHTYRVEFLNVG